MTVETKIDFSKYKLVRVDACTHETLRRLSGSRPMSKYLKELISKVDAEGVPGTPVLDEVRQLSIKLDDFIGGFHLLYRENKAGEIVPVTDEGLKFAGPASEGRGVPLFDLAMLQGAIEEDPNVKRVGWYEKNEKGEWAFDTEGFEKWAEWRDTHPDEVEENARKLGKLKRGKGK